jgi:hypothetical protein
MMILEHSVEWLAKEVEVLGENLPQCHFVHYKSHVIWHELEPVRRSRKPATNRLSYDTANSTRMEKWTGALKE